MSCQKILRTGPRCGEECAKRGVMCLEGVWYCQRHVGHARDVIARHDDEPAEQEGSLARSNDVEPESALARRNRTTAWRRSNVLCEYLPHGIPLADVEHYDAFVDEDVEGEERMKMLRGYINLRIGHPVFADEEETLPLVFTRRVKGGDLEITKRYLAEELADTVGYILSRPDVYRVGDKSLAELVLKKVEWDSVRSIFVAVLE